MPRETARQKADRVLTDGRLAVLHIERDIAAATVRGEGHVYSLGYRDGVWYCSCPARSDGCSHLYALKRVVVIDLKGRR